MAKIVIVVPPLTGHINPALSVAAELRQRGHTVVWITHADRHCELLPPEAEVHLLPSHPVLDGLAAAPSVRGLESVQFFYEGYCLPLARVGLVELERIVVALQPEVLISDHQMMAGPLVARRLGLPWLTFASTNVSTLMGSTVADEWVERQWALLQHECGLMPVQARPDFSPYGVIVFSSAALPGDQYSLYPANYHFVGPAFTHRQTNLVFPWNELRADTVKLLISLGTVSRDHGVRFFDVMMQGLAELTLPDSYLPRRQLQVVMVAPEQLQERAPSNFIVRSRVPQIDLLPSMDAVLCHAGHNTVCETLSFGLPLIVAPIRDDQPVVAQQVIHAGAGMFMRFGKVTPAMARSKVCRLFADVCYRQQAQRLQESLRGLGGANAAADVIEQVLAMPSRALRCESVAAESVRAVG